MPTRLAKSRAVDWVNPALENGVRDGFQRGRGWLLSIQQLPSKRYRLKSNGQLQAPKHKNKGQSTFSEKCTLTLVLFELLGRNEPYGLYSTAAGVDWDAIDEQRTDQPSNHVGTSMTVIRNYALILQLALGVMLVACGSEFNRTRAAHVQRVDMPMLVSESGRYNGVPIKIDLCVNVTIHGITLLQCGTTRPQIDFETGPADGSREAYTRLVKFAHANLGRKPEDLAITIEGIYRRSGATIPAKHTIYITDFVPH